MRRTEPGGGAAGEQLGYGRRPELDGLRGVAILLVLAQHYVVGITNVPERGWLGLVLLPARLTWTGVDLFFVLSGYLLGSILIANRDSPTLFRTFYIRRALRILPLYFALLLIVYLFSDRIWNAPRPPLLLYATLTQNFWMALAGTLGSITLAVTWSLAVEEQFYLVLPALVRFIKRARLWYALVLCIALAPLARAALFWLYGAKAIIAAQVLLFTRLDTLMLGVLLAYVEYKRIDLPERSVRLLWIASAVGLLVIMWFSDFRKPNLLLATVIFDIVALFYGSTLLLVLRGRFRFLRRKFFVYTGLIAYGLYLLHQPVNALLRPAGPGVRSWHEAFTMIVSLGIVYAMAAMSWEFFEKPLVRYGHRYAYEPAERSS